MGLQDSVSWYQKKIGTYDKQQWEKTVEQRILHGLTHVMKKTAKLKTDLIDVDLVRGSLFPKAKPKHGLITVTKLALIRWLFLPLYAFWWIEQTCLSIFGLLLLLYVLQLCNMIVYFLYYDDQTLGHISSYEVLVPAGMMLVLSIIHSQIVSTNNNSHNYSKSRSKRRRIKRRNFSFDKKADVYSSKESVSPTSGKSRTDFKLDSVVDNAVRRKNIAWGVPLQNITELKDFECNEEAEEGSKAVQDDDGFESLNSNGSSEMGDENQEGNQGDQPLSDDENFAKRSEKKIPEMVGTKQELNGALRCNEKEFDESFSCSKDCSCNLSEIKTDEESCSFHRDPRVFVQDVQVKRSEDSFSVLGRRHSGESTTRQ